MRLILSAMTLIVGSTMILSTSCNTAQPAAGSYVQEDGTNGVVDAVVKARFKATAIGDDGDKSLILGTIDNRPAALIQNSTLVVQLNKTLDWNNAKKACDTFAPAGKWMLPDEVTFIATLMLDLGLVFKTALPQGSDSDVHMMFLRSTPGSAFENSSKVAFMADGRGMEVDVLDLREMIEQVRKDLADAPKFGVSPEEQLPYRTFLDSLKDGIPAVCVLK